jgi:putative ABC transport system permease protein
VPGVRAVSGIAQDGGLAYGDVEFVNRIEPATIGEVFSFDWAHGNDRVPASLGNDGAIVDENWATEHKLAVGSTFKIRSAKGVDLWLTVRGIEKSPVLDALGLGPITLGAAAYDRAFTNRKTLLTLVSSEKSAAGGLKKVMATHPDAQLQTTADWVDDRAAQVDTLVGIFMVMLALAVFVSLIGIINTLLLATFERTRELGMLRAVGMSRRQMRRMVRHESVITALLGAISGMAAGLAIAYALTTVFADEGFAFVVPVPMLAVFTLVAVLAGVAAAVFPARRAAKLDPLTALAYE